MKKYLALVTMYLAMAWWFVWTAVFMAMAWPANQLVQRLSKLVGEEHQGSVNILNKAKPFIN